MRELFWKFFPPYEVVAFKREIDKFLARNFSDQMLYLDLLDLSESPHKYADSTPEKVVEEIRIKHRSAEEFAISALVNVCGKRLSSARHRDNSGRFDHNGLRLIELVRSAFQEMAQKNYMTEERAEKSFAGFKERIS